METKDPTAPPPTTPAIDVNDPLVREALAKLAAGMATEPKATEPKAPSQFAQALTKLKGTSVKQWLTLAATLLAGAGGTWMLKPGAPGPAVPWGAKGTQSGGISIRQSMTDVTVDGCTYKLFTVGESTNANFSASLTHSGTCSNWMAHKSYMQ